MKYCEKCGTQNRDELRYCRKCGKPFGTPTNFYGNSPSITSVTNISKKLLNNMTAKIKAQTAIALGIAAIIIVFAGLKPTNSMFIHRLLTMSGFIMGILSVVFSSLAKKEARVNKSVQGIATLSFVLSIIACSISSLIFFACTACVACVSI